MINYSARRLNKLLETMSPSARYLEIGVETGQTFFDVAASFKTAVDPKFLFDLDNAQHSDSSKFFQITSDMFFCMIDTSLKYDLVFLDGLHSWEQTYRDFCNSLLVTHDKSVIVLDDIFPSDVFSCNRDQVEALLMRQCLTSDPSIAWHGDTYKVIPLIRAFHPLLSFCTIISDGNPQAIVWRSKRECESISSVHSDIGSLNMPSLDYLWFLKNQHLYNPMSEIEALDLVIQTLKQ